MLLRSGVGVGISTHSLWELCRARSLAPRYVACGPVWPTLTKAMPWRPQGLHNLSWWCAVSEHPVVAIGGVLEESQAREAASCGADGVCVVRAIEHDVSRRARRFMQAMSEGAALAGADPAPNLPRPTL
jgi:hydroxymethylpyrimidine kinase / phosphomethylpyrimidine kinase / thiamine-phosphate diphosphorylase